MHLKLIQFLPSEYCRLSLLDPWIISLSGVLSIFAHFGQIFLVIGTGNLLLTARETLSVFRVNRPVILPQFSGKIGSIQLYFSRFAKKYSAKSFSSVLYSAKIFRPKIVKKWLFLTWVLQWTFYSCRIYRRGIYTWKY